MPTVLSHAIVPLAVGVGVGRANIGARLLLLCMACAVLPDADVLAFKLGIPYSSPWGHRGFTHSIAFSAFLGALAFCFSRALKATKIAVLAWVFLSTLSHALLDGLTDGGLGVALGWPFSDDRIFFPWQPIAVSPIGLKAFFTLKGAVVLRSEAVWIWMPCVIVAAALMVANRAKWLALAMRDFGPARGTVFFKRLGPVTVEGRHDGASFQVQAFYRERVQYREGGRALDFKVVHWGSGEWGAYLDANADWLAPHECEVIARERLLIIGTRVAAAEKALNLEAGSIWDPALYKEKTLSR